MFAANGRNDHVTMFILHLPLAVFSLSVKLSIFAFSVQNYFALFSSVYIFFQENINTNLTFVVNVILNLSKIAGMIAFEIWGIVFEGDYIQNLKIN